PRQPGATSGRPAAGRNVRPPGNRAHRGAGRWRRQAPPAGPPGLRLARVRDAVAGLRVLHEADAVAERVPDREVDPVELLGGLLGDLHALRPQCLTHGVGVVGYEADGEARGALGDQFADLLRGLRVHAGRRGLLEEDVSVGDALGPNGQPAHLATEDHVGADLQAELAYVEVQRLVLVEDPDVRDVDALDH